MSNQNNSTNEDRFARQDQRRYSGWSSAFTITGIVIVPAALPITAPFFFESETAGLMFVWHRRPQVFGDSFFLGFRVKMQPQTTRAIIAAASWLALSALQAVHICLPTAFDSDMRGS